MNLVDALGKDVGSKCNLRLEDSFVEVERLEEGLSVVTIPREKGGLGEPFHLNYIATELVSSNCWKSGGVTGPLTREQAISFLLAGGKLVNRETLERIKLETIVWYEGDYRHFSIYDIDKHIDYRDWKRAGID